MKQSAAALIAVVLVAAVVLAAVVASFYGPSGPTPQDNFRLVFVKTGGFAGVNDTLVVQNNGSAVMNSKYGVSYRGTMGPVEFSELKQVIAANIDNISPRTLQAKPGSADYFGYSLTVTTATGIKEMSWVDQWAVNGTFPKSLNSIQGEIQKATDYMSGLSYSSVHSSVAGALNMSVMTDKSSYNLGDHMRFVVLVENTGSSNVTYSSPTPCDQSVRVVMSNSSANRDITSNEGGVCVQVLQGRTLEGHSYIVETGSWDLTMSGSAVSPGVYTISAVFPYASFEKTLISLSATIPVAA